MGMGMGIGIGIPSGALNSNRISTPTNSILAENGDNLVSENNEYLITE